MKPIQFLLTALLLSTLATLQAAGPKPNIIFILADDLGWKDTSLYGSKYCETPHILRPAHRPRENVRPP